MNPVFVFPTGTSFGNTMQICKSLFGGRTEFTEGILVCSEETIGITQKICENLSKSYEGVRVSPILKEDFEKSVQQILADKLPHLLVGPSTRENQLHCFATLCEVRPPTIWFIYEKIIGTGGVKQREITSFNEGKSFSIEKVTLAEVLSLLDDLEREMLCSNNIGWDENTGRFTYVVDCKGNSNPSRNRKWQDNEISVVHKIRDVVGMHGLKATHTTIPKDWAQREQISERFSSAKIRGGLE